MYVMISSVSNPSVSFIYGCINSRYYNNNYYYLYLRTTHYSTDKLRMRDATYKTFLVHMSSQLAKHPPLPVAGTPARPLALAALALTHPPRSRQEERWWWGCG